MSKESKEFGKNLIEIREKKGLRQSDVAEMAGISQRTIGRLERGEIANASVDSLIELSKVYEEDIFLLYKSIKFGSYKIYDDIIKKLDINTMCLSNREKIDLKNQISIIENDKNLACKKYNLELIKLFILYISNEFDSVGLANKFYDITSKRINKDIIGNKNLSNIESRLLINIATTNKEYCGISNVDIINILNNQENNLGLTIILNNNLANIYRKEKKYKEALNVIDKEISICTSRASIDGLSYLYFTKFLIEYEGEYDFVNSLNTLNVLENNIKNKRLQKLIERKLNNILI